MAPRTTTLVQAQTAQIGESAKAAPADAATPGKRPWNPMSLTWSERYHDTFEKTWGYVPDVFKKFLVTVAIFAVGIAMNGDWVVLYVHIRRQLGLDPIPDKQQASFNWDLKSLKLENIGTFWIASNLVSYGLYFVIGGFLHWYFYVRQRDRAQEWKIQPNSWLSPELEWHEIKVGSASLFVTGTSSAFLACYISNGGWSTVYYKWDEYGKAWWFLQWAAIFIYQDYITYWIHRLYHTPFFYKRFHKLHHTYKHPTAFSVTAIHPFEVLHIQACLCAPLFMFPVHWFPFYIIALYTYYHGIIDHSGINFKAYWWQPWQPDAIFHDNHHQYFHVNFGFNIWLWDKLHGTYRRKDRLYREDLFYGKGKALSDASTEEIAADLAERRAENPKAYRNDNMEFALSEAEIERAKSS